MTTDTDEKLAARRVQAEAIARTFEAMAARIRRNQDEIFGGVALIVPPMAREPAFEMLTLNTAEPVLFWLAIKATTDPAYQAAQDTAARQRTPY